MSQPEHELRDDLKTTSEHVEATAERIGRLEEEKRALDPTDPRVDELSREIERLAAGLQKKVRVERKLAKALDPGD